MFEQEEYVPDYSAHVRKAKSTLHNEHVQAYMDMLTDIMLAKMGAVRVRPSLVRVDEIGIQPMSGPVPLSFTNRMSLRL